MPDTHKRWMSRMSWVRSVSAQGQLKCKWKERSQHFLSLQPHTTWWLSQFIGFLRKAAIRKSRLYSYPGRKHFLFGSEQMGPWATNTQTHTYTPVPAEVHLDFSKDLISCVKQSEGYKLLTYKQGSGCLLFVHIMWFICRLCKFLLVILETEFDFSVT